MSNQQYKSDDFDKTPPTFQVKLPERLIHKNVEELGPQFEYSSARKHPVFFIDLPSYAISVTIGGLIPGGSSNRHRHSYETLLYVIEGKGYTQVEDRKIEWEAGDAVYIPVWAWHHHVNLDSNNSAKYVACENAPMLQNLGCLAVREEPN